MKIKVTLADDHPVVREGLRSVIENRSGDIEIIGEASNGGEVLEISKKKLADVYVLDISMPLLNGIETTQRLIETYSGSKIIILSFHDSRMFVEKAVRVGARGYLVKESATEEIIDAVYQVNEGKYFFSPAISKFIVDGFPDNSYSPKNEKTIATLTPRQKEILQLIAEGFTSKEISKKLFLSIFTVNVHRKNIMLKLGLTRQADLIRYAIKEGILQL